MCTYQTYSLVQGSIRRVQARVGVLVDRRAALKLSCSYSRQQDRQVTNDHGFSKVIFVILLFLRYKRKTFKDGTPKQAPSPGPDDVTRKSTEVLEEVANDLIRMGDEIEQQIQGKKKRLLYFFSMK